MRRLLASALWRERGRATGAALRFVLGPAALTALALKHANRKTASRVHHFMNQARLSAAFTAALLLRL
jgi:hypothetical protein